MTTEIQKTSISQKLTKALFEGGAIIALGTAILYIMGRAVNIGMSSFWSLPNSYYDNTIHETVYLGFLIFNLKSVTFLIKVFAWIIAFYVFMQLLIYVIYKFADKIRALVHKLEDKFEENENLAFYKVLSGAFHNWYEKIFSVIMLLLLFTIISGKFIEYGKEFSQISYKSYKSQESPNYYINKNRKFYIVGNDNLSTALYFPDKDELEIVSRDWLIGSKRPIFYQSNEKLDDSGNAKK